MLIPSFYTSERSADSSLSRGMNANSQLAGELVGDDAKSIKRDEC